MAKSTKKTAQKTATKVVAKKAVKAKAEEKTAKKTAVKTAEPAAQPVAQGSIKMSPYLMFNGNCEKAFTFYKSVFGSEIPQIVRFKDMPPMEGKTISKEDGKKIMHVRLPIGNGAELMGSDTTEGYGPPYIVGNNFSISLMVTSKEEADRLYKGLSKGGKATMPMTQTFWGSYFGMLTDKFDFEWMISFDIPK